MVQDLGGNPRSSSRPSPDPDPGLATPGKFWPGAQGYLTKSPQVGDRLPHGKQFQRYRFIDGVEIFIMPS